MSDLSPSIRPVQRWLEDVTVGHRLEPQVRATSRLQLLQYASVSRDLNLIHHDPEVARSGGLPDTIIQGSLKSAFMARLATAFAGEWGTLRRLTVQYRGIDVPGASLTAHGVVERVDTGRGEVECRLWLETAPGVQNTRGTAIVALPKRSDWLR
jgi:acyl dehydratase